jgi:hypothetical protein
VDILLVQIIVKVISCRPAKFMGVLYFGTEGVEGRGSIFISTIFFVLNPPNPSSNFG